uniref:Secreted protein n=1 Tax=Romanomermis culicivorax TaxID=13658 RepID=A0A915HG62_ROMCU
MENKNPQTIQRKTILLLLLLLTIGRRIISVRVVIGVGRGVGRRRRARIRRVGSVTVSRVGRRRACDSRRIVRAADAAPAFIGRIVGRGVAADSSAAAAGQRIHKRLCHQLFVTVVAAAHAGHHGTGAAAAVILLPVKIAETAAAWYRRTDKTGHWTVLLTVRETSEHLRIRSDQVKGPIRITGQSAHKGFFTLNIVLSRRRLEKRESDETETATLAVLIGHHDSVDDISETTEI